MAVVCARLLLEAPPLMSTALCVPPDVVACLQGFITGAVAAFAESPIDFYKSQIQVQMVRAKSDPAYKGEPGFSATDCTFDDTR